MDTDNALHLHINRSRRLDNLAVEKSGTLARVLAGSFA
jgi:hypothetical protein